MRCDDAVLGSVFRRVQERHREGCGKERGMKTEYLRNPPTSDAFWHYFYTTEGVNKRETKVLFSNSIFPMSLAGLVSCGKDVTKMDFSFFVPD